MFTGIVEERGRIVDVRLEGAQAGSTAGSARLTVHGPKVTSDVAQGDSIAVSGVCLTVVEVGEAWRDRFEPGQRLVLQADIYYRGKNLAYGYVFVGGLAQYSLLGPAALDGDGRLCAIIRADGNGWKPELVIPLEART